MNQERKSHDDPMLEPESPETLERLRKLELRLKATRPQSPQLDLAALQRMADDVSSGAIVERAPDRKSLPTLPRGKRRIGGRVLLIASSWMCGAGVGALVMFVLMSRTGTTPAPGDHAVRIRSETPESMSDDAIVDSSSEQLNPDRPEIKLSPVKPFTRAVHRSMLTMGSDPLRQWESTYLSDGPTLQVGMYLGRHGERSPQRMYKNQRENFGPQPGSPPAMESESPVSRRELMQEFLGESAAAVL